ncbi:MAG: hypothetical protein ACRDOB_17470 [Streptosporangiaceae bacterium]
MTADGAEQARTDVIVSGREPRRRSRWPVHPVWLLVVAQTAALAVLAAVLATLLATGAPHQGGGAGLARGGPQTSGQPALPQLSAVVLRLPAGGGVAGTVVITAAALPGAGRAQFTVSAVVTGGMPGTFYDLIGSACSTADPQPDDVWATGLAGPDGTADLAGYTWTGAVAATYWLTLDPSQAGAPPGLHGRFGLGQAASFPAGQAPCATAS